MFWCEVNNDVQRDAGTLRHIVHDICAFYVKASYKTSRALSSVCAKNLDEKNSFVNLHIKNPLKKNMERGPSGV